MRASGDQKGVISAARKCENSCADQNLISLALRNMFPSVCATAQRFAWSDIDALPETEAKLVCDAVPKRRREFTAGREAAREALRKAGCPGVVIGSDSCGAPQWPPGYMGSISHADGLAIAVAASAQNIGAIGIDLEVSDSVHEGLWEQVLHSEEVRNLLEFPKAERARWATVLFSAKEAFYKFQYPLTNAWLGFKDVKVSVNPQSRSFEVQLGRAIKVGLGEVQVFVGRFDVVASFVLTGLWLTVPRRDT